mgnify:CR=1 FL=1
MGKNCGRAAINKDLSLNPCFGGFGWESDPMRVNVNKDIFVLILVLVDLGGKGIIKFPYGL